VVGDVAAEVSVSKNGRFSASVIAHDSIGRLRGKTSGAPGGIPSMTTSSQRHSSWLYLPGVSAYRRRPQARPGAYLGMVKYI
jgi:hypothetical protein